MGNEKKKNLAAIAGMVSKLDDGTLDALKVIVDWEKFKKTASERRKRKEGAA